MVILGFSFWTAAQANALKDARIEDYEGRQVTQVELVFEGTPDNPNVQAELLAVLKVAANTPYSAVRVRESLQALFDLSLIHI